MPLKDKAYFFESVFAMVAAIPMGRVTTYGAIAHCLGSKKSARMVGWTLHQKKYATDYPAHRVVNRKGLLTGKQHFSTDTMMEELLRAEGIIIQNNQVQNFDQVFWDPIQAFNLGLHVQ